MKSQMKNSTLHPISALAASITKSASRQTYYIIRFLVDRGRAANAFLAYAYFRWVDDYLDAESSSRTERSAFINRQKSLLESCYRGESAVDLSPQEQMLAELVQSDAEKNNGLHSKVTPVVGINLTM